MRWNSRTKRPRVPSRLWFNRRDTVQNAKFRQSPEGTENGRACYLSGTRGERLYLAHLARITDEGGGKFRFRSTWIGTNFLGIYRQDQDRIILCFRSADAGRPTS